LILSNRLLQIRHVVHGFGNKDWGKSTFDSDPSLKRFRVLFLRQVHSDRVWIVPSAEQLNQKKKLAGDAAITEIPGILLFIKTADCLPVLLADASRPVVAAVHCGWRGTLKKILGKTVRLMMESFGCSPASLVAAFGPSINRDCYEVEGDMIREFRKEGFPESCFKPSPKKKEKYFLDLKKANQIQLENTGLAPENITIIDLCSHCEPDLYSYRRDQEKTGRNFSFIGLDF